MSLRNSFFDNEDLRIKFEFVHAEPKHNIIYEQLTFKDDAICKSLSTGTIMRGFFSLHGNYLVFYKDQFTRNSPIILEIKNARITLSPLNSSDSTQNLLLAKNGLTYELYFANQQIVNRWKNVLKNICVMTDFCEEFQAVRLLGEGSFAKTYLIESKTDGKLFAAKTFLKEKQKTMHKTNYKAPILNEIHILRSLNHDNIIQLHQVHETEKAIYLIMEYVESNTLLQVFNNQSLQRLYSGDYVIFLMHSLFEALAYLASKGIMHRDLKPENILLDKFGNLKIIDFGLSDFCNSSDLFFKKCGSPGYIAPEVFLYDAKNPNTLYNSRCDVFSAGCIFFHMLFGYSLMLDLSRSGIFKVNKEFNDQKLISILLRELNNSERTVNKEGLNLVLEMLECNPNKRITAFQALNHPYFKLVFSKIGLSPLSQAQSTWHQEENKFTEKDNSLNGKFSFNEYSVNKESQAKNTVYAGNIPQYTHHQLRAVIDNNNLWENTKREIKMELERKSIHVHIDLNNESWYSFSDASFSCEEFEDIGVEDCQIQNFVMKMKEANFMKFTFNEKMKMLSKN